MLDQVDPPTKVVLTIDVEPSISGAFMLGASYTPLLREPVAGSINGKSEALGFILNLLSECGLVATFFVETLHTRYFSDHAMGEYVEAILRAGHDVQLHLHPCWLAFEFRESDRHSAVHDDCHRLDEGQLVMLISEGAERIRAWTGVRATAMRTGNFSTSLAVFRAMGVAGLRHGSNICLALNRPPEPELAVQGGLHEFAGVRELPVTCFHDIGPFSRGRLRPMAVTATTAGEQIRLLKLAHAAGNGVAVLLTHPFEFIKKRDMRYTRIWPNRVVQKRFRELCSFLAKDNRRFQVLPLGVVAEDLELGRRWVELPGDALKSVGRTVQNVLNDHLRFI